MTTDRQRCNAHILLPDIMLDMFECSSPDRSFLQNTRERPPINTNLAALCCQRLSLRPPTLIVLHHSITISSQYLHWEIVPLFAFCAVRFGQGNAERGRRSGKLHVSAGPERHVGAAESAGCWTCYGRWCPQGPSINQSPPAREASAVYASAGRAASASNGCCHFSRQRQACRGG